MIDILSASLGILRESGYSASLTRLDAIEVLSFEDDTLLGCVFELPESIALLLSWPALEKAFLQANASRFRFAGDKSWNVYCVFLTAAEADEAKQREIRRIEENLNRTRKLTGCGISNKKLLTDALLPLLPLQQEPTLDFQSYDARLRQRLARTIGPSVEEAADASADPEKIAKILREL